MNSADIEAWFEDIAKEIGHLAARLERIDAGEKVEPGSQAEWEASLVCGSAAEKIYTGCERIMAGLAKSVDGVRVAQEGNWHRILLDRMGQPFGGRGPIVTAETFELLDKMRSFRHRERNSYGYDLRYDIVVLRARESIQAFEAFAADVRQFLKPRLTGDGTLS